MSWAAVATFSLDVPTGWSRRRGSLVVPATRATACVPSMKRSRKVNVAELSSRTGGKENVPEFGS